MPVSIRAVRTAEDERCFDQQEVTSALRRSERVEALASYQRMIARNPSDAGAHAGAGRALSALGLEEAAAALERSLTLSDTDASLVPQALAFVYFVLGDDASFEHTPPILLGIGSAGDGA